MPTLAQYALGLLLVAHGWVHLVYVASSRGWFGDGSGDGDSGGSGDGAGDAVGEADGWGWSGRSWLLSGVLDDRVVLDLASGPFVLVGVGFVAGAVGHVLSLDWSPPVLVGSALLSALCYVVLWGGRPTRLFEQGALGVLIDVAVVVRLVVLG